MTVATTMTSDHHHSHDRDHYHQHADHADSDDGDGGQRILYANDDVDDEEEVRSDVLASYYYI